MTEHEFCVRFKRLLDNKQIAEAEEMYRDIYLFVNPSVVTINGLRRRLQRAKKENEK